MEEMTEIIKGGEPFKTAQVFKTETVTEQSTEPKNIAICENAQVSNPIQTLFYRRLTPNETFKCDGESCSLLAQYEMIDSDPNNTEKPHYCESHFLLTRKGCSDNGFILKELEPQKISFRATQEEQPEFPDEQPDRSLQE